MNGRRIGIDVTSALSQGGGIGRYTRELVRAIVALNGDDEFHLFSARFPVDDQFGSLPAGARVHRHEAPLSERWLYRIWYRARLPIPVQWFTGALDLFHSPDFVLPPTSNEIPTLLTVHDLSFLYYPETFPTVLVDYLNRVVPWSVERAGHILADSKATKRDLLSQWGVPARKVTVLYSGVSEHFQPNEDQEAVSAVRAKYGLAQYPYVVAVGTVQPRKNYEMLIRAFRPLVSRLPHRLALAGGRGWLDEGLKREVARQGLEERVIFTGFVADVDLPALYSGASLLVFPSLYEGFGLPIVEAMACGLPCLISNASSLPEVGGDAAVQLAPHDESAWSEAMLEILMSDDQRAAMSAAGLLQAREFSWKKAAERLLQVYNELLAGLK